MSKVLGLVIVSVMLGACGGGGGSGGDCQQIGSALCAKACSCHGGGACAVYQDSVTLDFASQSDCLEFFVTLGCSMGDKAAYNDAAACLPLAQAATCTSTGSENAVSYPADMSCQTP